MSTIVPVAEWLGQEAPNMQDKWVPLTKRSEFVLHHLGGDLETRTGYALPRAINKYHTQIRGWVFAGYNYVIESNSNSPTDGLIYEMRGRDIRGAHCKGHNVSGLGILVAIGKNQKPTEKALRSIKWLWQEASKQAGRTLSVITHSDESTRTHCPEKYLKYFINSKFDVETTMQAGQGIPSTSAEDSSSDRPTPQTKIITLQHVQLAAEREYLEGDALDNRTQILHVLKDMGCITKTEPVTGGSWVFLFKTAWRRWQEKIGYQGKDANGIPAEVSVFTLTTRMGFNYWNLETGNDRLTPQGVSLALSTQSKQNLINPTEGGHISIPFGRLEDKSTMWRMFGKHTGVDISRTSVSGLNIYAVCDGVVTYKWHKGLGHVAILKADCLKNFSHRYFWYSHLDAPPLVTGRVEQGQVIGTMGSTGDGSNGVHLHLELQRSGRHWGTSWSDFTDPTPFIKQS